MNTKQQFWMNENEIYLEGIYLLKFGRTMLDAKKTSSTVGNYYMPDHKLNIGIGSE